MDGKTICLEVHILHSFTLCILRIYLKFVSVGSFRFRLCQDESCIFLQILTCTLTICIFRSLSWDHLLMSGFSKWLYVENQWKVSNSNSALKGRERHEGMNSWSRHGDLVQLLLFGLHSSVCSSPLTSTNCFQLASSLWGCLLPHSRVSFCWSWCMQPPLVAIYLV